MLEEFERLFRLSESQIAILASDMWPVHDANLKHLEVDLPSRLEDEDNEVAMALRQAMAWQPE